MEEDTEKELRKKADLFESQYTNLRKEFKDFIETSRRNEETKKKELRTDSAKKMLTIADSLSRMSVPDTNYSCDVVKNFSDNFQKNIEVIYQQLLSSSGLTPVDPAPGDPFDDTRHMAVGLEYGSHYPEDTVFKVIRKGYSNENMLVRPAEVIISKHPVEPAPVRKTGIWNRLTRWFSPSQHRFALLDQQMDELSHIQDQKTLRLQEEMEALQECIARSGEEKEKMDELCEHQDEKIEQLEQEIEAFRDLLTEAEKNNQKYRTLEKVMNEKTGGLEREIGALKNRVMHESENTRKIRDLEHLCHEMMHRFEQELSAYANKTSAEDTHTTEPGYRKEPVRTGNEMPGQNYQEIPPGKDDQKHEGILPSLLEDTDEDMADGDDEPLFDEEVNDEDKKYL